MEVSLRLGEDEDMEDEHLLVGQRKQLSSKPNLTFIGEI